VTGEAALQALGRQFDGRQGFFIHGDAPGHLTPGRQPLARSSSVKSSNTKNHSQILARLIPEGGGFHQKVEGLVGQHQMQGLFTMPGETSGRAARSAMRSNSAGGKSIRQSWPGLFPFQTQHLGRGILMLVTARPRRCPITPAATFFNRTSMSRFWVEIRAWLSLRLPIRGRQLRLALLQILGHLIEGLDQKANFVRPS